MCNECKKEVIMKINPIKYFEKQNPIKLMKNTAKVSGGMLLGGLLMMYGAYSDRERLTHDIKKQVKATGISQEDFKKLNDSISIWNTRDKAIAWQHALDSIQMKSTADKDVFEANPNINNK